MARNHDMLGGIAGDMTFANSIFDPNLAKPVSTSQEVCDVPVAPHKWHAGTLAIHQVRVLAEFRGV